MKYPLFFTLLLASSVFAADITKNVNVNVNQDNDNFDATVTITTSDENGKTTTTEKKAHSQDELDRILAQHELDNLETEVEIEKHRSIADLRRAKEELERARHEVKMIKDYGDNIRITVDSDVQKTPRLGFVPDKTKRGIELAIVIPNSPAAKAGMQSGDLIQSVRGEKVDKNASLEDVTELIGKLEEGETVAFDVLRGEQRLSFKPKAHTASSNEIVKLIKDKDFFMKFSNLAQQKYGYGNPGIDQADLKIVAEYLNETDAPLDGFVLGTQLNRVKLVKLNPELGKYFGTDSGILIVKIEKDNILGLISGDVIKTIDGREVTSPSHMMRILKSYNSGDKLNIKIFRNKHKKTLKAIMPEEEKLGSLFGEPEQEVEFMVAKQNK
ncbi:MAG: PDZ domain-containing protein [bacterium]